MYVVTCLQAFLLSRNQEGREKPAGSKDGGGAKGAQRTATGGIRWPTYYSKDLDLGHLYRIVMEKGGYATVTRKKEWRKCSVLLGIVQKGTVSVAYVLRNAYERFLKDYEEWKASGGVGDGIGDAIDEATRGGAEVPSLNDADANGVKTEKQKFLSRAFATAAETGSHANGHASDEEMEDDGGDDDDDVEDMLAEDNRGVMCAAAAAALEIADGKALCASAPISRGGCGAEFSPSAETTPSRGNTCKTEFLESIADGLLNMQGECAGKTADTSVERHGDEPASKRLRFSEDHARGADHPSTGVAATATAATTAVVSNRPTRRRVGIDTAGMEGRNNQAAGASRLDARAEDHDPIASKLCQLCYGGDHDDKTLLCDRCNKAYHMFCLVPPLLHVPEGEWLCPACRVSDVVGDEVGFLEGDVYTFQQFKDMAEKFAAQVLSSRGVRCSRLGEGSTLNRGAVKDIEAAFWKIVENQEPQVEVSYAADLDTSTFGSGFAKGTAAKREVIPPGGTSASKWNLNMLPRQSGANGSLLRHSTDDIPGVVVPWIYFGMLFSSFCWHVEDHMFYSVNYHHFGDPKVWYGVPSSSASLFEETFRTALPEQFSAQPDLLFHLVTLLSPSVLQAKGVPVYRVVQEPGNFVVTFPNGYHGGFNAGLNCAEAVNFAPYDWLRFGHLALDRYRKFNIRPPLSHEELAINAAISIATSKQEMERHTGSTARWLAADIYRILERERNARYRLHANGLTASRCLPPGIGLTRSTTSKSPLVQFDVLRGEGVTPTHGSMQREHAAGGGSGEDYDEEEKEALCSVCKSSLYLSGCECDCSPGRAVCIEHVDELCQCPHVKKRLLYRFPLAYRERLSSSLEAAAGREAAACGRIDDVEFATSLDAIRRAGGADVGKGATSMFSNQVEEQVSRARAWESVASEVFACSDSMVQEKTCTENGRPFSDQDQGQHVSLDTLRRLAQESQSFAWAGTAVYEAAPSLSALTILLQWADDVIYASESSSVRLWKAEEILSRAPRNVRVSFDELTLLETKVNVARDLGSKISRAIQNRDCDTKTLNSLRNDAIMSSVSIPELSALASATKRINAWEYRLRKVFPKSSVIDKRVRHPLYELEQLVEQGKELPVIFKRMEELEGAVAEVREWQRRARALLAVNGDAPPAGGGGNGEVCTHSNMERNRGVRPSLVELQLLHYQAEDLKVCVEEMGDIEQRVSSAEDWMSDYETIKDELEQVDIDVIESFVVRGEDIPVYMPETGVLRRHLGVRRWTEFKRAMTRTKVSSADIKRILDEGESLPERPPEQELENLRGRLREADEWRARIARVVPEMLRTGNPCVGSDSSHLPPICIQDSPKIQMAELVSIVNAGSRIAVRLDELPLLSEKLAVAQGWLNRANAVLRFKRAHASRRTGTSSSAGGGGGAATGGSSTHTVKQVEALIEEADCLEVTVTEVEGLRTVLERAHAWSHHALAVLREEDLGSWNEHREENEAYHRRLEAMLDEGKAFGISLESIRILSSRITSLEWDMEAMRLLDSVKADAARPRDDKATAGATLPGSRNDPVEWDDLTQHARACNGLTVSDDVLRELESLIAVGDSWEKRAKRLLDRKNAAAIDEDDEKKSVNDISKYISLIEDARKVNALLPSLPLVEGIVEAHRNWELKAAAILEEATIAAVGVDGEQPMVESMTMFNGATISRRRGRVPLSQWRELLETNEGSEVSMVVSESRKQVEAIALSASKWIDRCRRAVSRRGPMESAETLLTAILDGLERAVRPAAASDIPEEEIPHCLCQATIVENDSSMVCCDTCDEWFHLRCVGITKAAERKLKNFECFICRAVGGDLSALSHRLKDYKRYRTGRPSLDTIIELIREESELSCGTVEGDILWRIAAFIGTMHERCCRASSEYALAQRGGPLSPPPPLPSSSAEHKAASPLRCTEDLEADADIDAQIAYHGDERVDTDDAPGGDRPSDTNPEMAEASTEGASAAATAPGTATDSIGVAADTAIAAVPSAQRREAVEMRGCLKAVFAMEVHCPETEDIVVRSLLTDVWAARAQELWMNPGAADTAVPMLTDVQSLVDDAQMLRLFPSEADADATVDVQNTEAKEEEAGEAPKAEAPAPRPEATRPSRESVSEMVRGLKGELHATAGDKYKFATSLLAVMESWLASFAAVEECPDKFPVSEIRSLIEESRGLPLAMHDLGQYVELLDEMCKEYCVCRSRYNPVRPMICCDSCDGWFHYECVGLCVPADADAAEEDHAFVCPNCVATGNGPCKEAECTVVPHEDGAAVANVVGGAAPTAAE